MKEKQIIALCLAYSRAERLPNIRGWIRCSQIREAAIRLGIAGEVSFRLFCRYQW